MPSTILSSLSSSKPKMITRKVILLLLVPLSNKLPGNGFFFKEEEAFLVVLIKSFIACVKGRLTILNLSRRDFYFSKVNRRRIYFT